MSNLRGPVEMPSRRQLALGMAVLMLVGGFAMTRGERPLRPTGADTHMSAGLESGASERREQIPRFDSEAAVSVASVVVQGIGR